MRSIVVLLAAMVVVLVGPLTARAGVISGPLGDSGWSVESSGGSTSVMLDRNLYTDDQGRRCVEIEISKDLSPIYLNFFQAALDNATANRIIIVDENITNLTGVPWYDFHWFVGYTDVAQFNRELTYPTVNPNSNEPGWSIDPFTTHDWPSGQTVGADELSVAGGTVPNNSVFHPGLVSGNLVIDINLDGDSMVHFFLKELPTIPEPANVLLIGCGSMALLRRRRARLA
jgi:hypothetical protein